MVNKVVVVEDNVQVPFKSLATGEMFRTFPDGIVYLRIDRAYGYVSLRSGYTFEASNINKLVFLLKSTVELIPQ